jgi:hypothetical protein
MLSCTIEVVYVLVPKGPATASDCIISVVENERKSAVNATVPLASGKLIVLSAVGSTTPMVVSKY